MISILWSIGSFVISACHLFICLQKVALQVQVECTDSSIETHHVYLCLLSLLYPFVSRFTMTNQENFNIERKFCKYDPNFWTILLQLKKMLNDSEFYKELKFCLLALQLPGKLLPPSPDFFSCAAGGGRLLWNRVNKNRTVLDSFLQTDRFLSD